MPHLPSVSHRRRTSLTSSRASSIDETRQHGEEVSKEDETVMDSEQGNMLMHIISQLRPGADLSRVTLPTFILEPRSMLERITNFMAHPEVMLPITKIEDPTERFVAVTKFYLSGWHIKPPGVKKPLNPILGEIFTGFWDYPDGTKGYYISEQTSHHPPKSSYFFMAPEHDIRIDGTLKPRSKFLGNSAGSMMEGIAILRLLNTGERFFVTQPNMYARGILFGTMKYELGDHAYIKCPETGLVADLEFKTKGYFSGTYNAIGGFIKDAQGNNLYELSGLWNGEMFIKDLTTGKKELLFDAGHTKHTPPNARPLEEQEERESQRLWHDTTEAVKQRDQDAATDAKAKIEDRQREEAAKRNNEGIDWKPQLFRRVQGGQGGLDEGEEDLDWIINAKVDAKTPEDRIKQILQIHAILPGQRPERQFNIPSRTNSLQITQSNQSTQQPTQQPAQQPAQPPAQQPAQQPTQQPTQRSAETPAETPAEPSRQPLKTHEEARHASPISSALLSQQQNKHDMGKFIDAGLPIQSKAPIIDVTTTNQSLLNELKSPTESISPETRDQVAQELPPSKLLHSNPKEEAKGRNTVRRMDSQTQEAEEFHDAES